MTIKVINKQLPREEGAVPTYEMYILDAETGKLYVLAYDHDTYNFYCQKVPPYHEIIDESDNNVRQLPNWSQEAMLGFALWRRKVKSESWHCLDSLEESYVHELAKVRAQKVQLLEAFKSNI